jgi:hypothetical protein
MGGESVELLSRELGLPIFTLEQWRQKADAALDGALQEREADATSIERDAAMTRIGELSMEVERLARASRNPALWPAGGRADGQGDLPHRWPALRHPARLPALGRAALELPRRSGEERRAGGSARTTRA